MRTLTTSLAWSIVVASTLIGCAIGNVPVFTGILAACTMAAYGTGLAYLLRARSKWHAAVANHRTHIADANLRRRAQWITLTIVDRQGNVLASTLEQLATDITPPDGVSIWLDTVSTMLWYGDPDVPPTMEALPFSIPTQGE